MIVRTFDNSTLSKKETLPWVQSSKWVKRFYEVGSFEITFTECNIEPYDIITQGDNVGIVLEVVKNIPDEVTVYGYDLKGLTEFRYINGNHSYTNKGADYIYKDLANEYMINIPRSFNRLEIKQTVIASPQIPNYVSQNQTLSKEFENLAKMENVGYDIVMEGNWLYFKTIGIRQKQDVVFSNRHNNLQKAVFTKSVFDEQNVIYYTDGNGIIKTDLTAGSKFRREGYTSKLEDVEKVLADKIKTEEINAEVNDLLEYGIDYQLGDIVTVQFGNLNLEKIISEVEFNYSPQATRIFPTFGRYKENKIKKLMKG